jgi:putative selenate reductase
VADRFRPLGAADLAAWIAAELEGDDAVFGIPRGLWFTPSAVDRFGAVLHGRRVGAPIGVAAGPHTQLAQNIVVAWLCGARVVELKTVQTLDRIEVSKPCIDMLDEGLNVEWSQELSLGESLEQYLAAWVLIHALHARLGLPGETPDVVLDVSVGYDLGGLEQPNMRRFLEGMTEAGDELERCRAAVARSFPEASDGPGPGPPAASATVSTLHGCPPAEIAAMARLLMERWRLPTAVKLNPTLLGLETVRRILVDELGWRHLEPQRRAFAADLGWDDALDLIGDLERSAGDLGVGFGLKLCNTLPVVNRRPELAAAGDTAYLSGRPLHALAVELASRLASELGGRLPISFAGGVDAGNAPALLAGGLRPLTLCSDLLRPGGYLRLGAVLEAVAEAIDLAGAADLDDLAVRTAGGGPPAEAKLRNLARYGERLRRDPEVAREGYRRSPVAWSRQLGLFDCISAPCTDACAISQRAPAYLRRVAAGDLAGAAAVIARDNPLPTVLGRACHHPCEPACSRGHLDRPVAIREVKRFVTDHAPPPPTASRPRSGSLRVAVVGAGPCGLAAAVELARAGVPTTVFEARDRAGGMVSATIPGYRASSDAVERDLSSIAALGVAVETGATIGSERCAADLLEEGFDHVVVAVGAQRGARLGIEGDDADGVVDGLDFLRAARRGVHAPLPGRTIVVGGGDVAVDCARTARRLADGPVEILYRRSTAEMPAHPDDLGELIGEGVTIRELRSPRRVVVVDGRVTAVECSVTALAGTGEDGRRRAVEVQGELETLAADTLIVAIGQLADLSVFGASPPATTSGGFVAVDPATLETSIPRLWAGGDLRSPGPSTIVDACADGRRIARAILEREGRAIEAPALTADVMPDRSELLRRRSRKRSRVRVERSTGPGSPGFAEVTLTLTPDAARAEAARCLDCDLLCNACESVCPNRAIIGYRTAAAAGPGDRGRGPVRTVAGQPFQVAVIADLCNECGNCVAFCPTSGRPWRDKPRLFLHRADFEAERDNAFMLLIVGRRRAIQGRFDGRLHQLVDRDVPVYVGAGVRLELDRELSPLEPDGCPGEDVERCAVLAALLLGLTGSLPHLPLDEADPGWLLADD